ncbi:MAG TPA: amidase [Gemmatimonadaceae bacterium]|jgi:aspartyl-tRNA(Asn)/glutamyl-tRNA(Gln) amidotransferase subunit A
MSPTRREALLQLAALSTLPLRRWPSIAADPLDGTIAEYQAGRRRGEWTAVAVTTRALERCQTVGARLHAVDALANTAIAEARASDERLRAGNLRGPMDGVPVFAKAIYDVNGLPTTGSNAEWARLFPDRVNRDAIEVTRLRAAGAVVLGKTAADDFAYHGNGTSSHTGQVLNPHDPAGTRTPGGSSAGSAVAVATGLAFAALGTDDGGSNRIPAQFTGVVGMKPTFGLVPRNGVIPTWPYLDTHGPLARSVADAALLLSVVAGPDSSDPLALSQAFDPLPFWSLSDTSLNDVKLGIVDSHVPRDKMTTEALVMWDRALADLRAAGATVDVFDAAANRVNYRDLFNASATARGDVPVNADSPPPTANALQLYFAGRAKDARAAIRRGYDAYRKFYDVLPATYEQCASLFDQPMTRDPAGQSFAKARAEVVAKLAASMRAAGIAAMVYPTVPFNAPRAADAWPDIRTALGYGNWLGLPEVSVPAGMGADGMPALNLSIVGLPGADARVLALAHAYEQRSRRFVAPHVS